MSFSKWYPNDNQNSPQGEDEIPKNVALFDLAKRGLLESSLWWMFLTFFESRKLFEEDVARRLAYA